jgi:poly-gamma-glutamate synthesis protein (capsule biosynthesis protein)
MKLVFLGDLSLRTNRLPLLGSELAQVLSDADYVCVNLEGPVFSDTLPPSIKAGPSISQDKAVIDFLSQCSVSHINLANNHIMDFGVRGLDNTLLATKQFHHIGVGSEQSAYEAKYVHHQGVSIALIGLSEAQFGVLQDSETITAKGIAWVDHPNARAAVKKARERADYVIVQVHAGLEMVDLPLPEWRSRYREFIDLGADLIVGHHPHVVQGSESYSGKMIFYSLGNFYMELMDGLEGEYSGGLLQVTIDERGLQPEFFNLKLSNGQVNLDLSADSKDLLTRLNHKLADPIIYEQEISKACKDFWEKVYAPYYETALLGLGVRPKLRKLLLLLRRLLGLVIRGNKASKHYEALLMHNIRIETHRWVVCRALGFSISQQGLNVD